MTVTLDFASEGACRGVDPDLFFPDRGESGDEAKAVCARCPVREQCLEWALLHESRGIWGGESEKARKVIRRRRGMAVQTPTVAPSLCGTPSGYRAHRLRGEVTCPACRAANALRNEVAKERRGLGCAS